MIALRMMLAEWQPARTGLRRPTTMLALGLWIVVVLAGFIAPFSGVVPGMDVDVSRAGLGPSSTAWLGTDHLGRDVFWRLTWGCRAFTMPGTIALVVVLAVGLPIGALSGWRTGPTSAGLRFVSDALASVPRLVFVLLVSTILGAGLVVLGVAAGLAFVPTFAEAIRDRVTQLRLQGHVEGWRAHGLSDARILWVHMVCVGCGRLIARRLIELFGFVLVLETTLSYIGMFGVQEPTPSWGNMLAFDWGRASHLVPWLAPAVAIWLTLAATARLAELFTEDDR